MSTVSLRRMTIGDVFQAVEQSGGGPQLVPSGVSTVWTKETLAEDTPGRECPHVDVGLRSWRGTTQMSEDRVPSMNIESLYGGGGGVVPLRCYRKSSSGEVSSCACAACRYPGWSTYEGVNVPGAVGAFA